MLQQQGQYSLPAGVSSSSAQLEYSLQQQPDSPVCEVKYFSLGSAFACMAAHTGNTITTINVSLQQHVDLSLIALGEHPCSVCCRSLFAQACLLRLGEGAYVVFAVVACPKALGPGLLYPAVIKSLTGKLDLQSARYNASHLNPEWQLSVGDHCNT